MRLKDLTNTAVITTLINRGFRLGKPCAEEEVPQELQELINGCKTLPELYHLLFAIDYKGEAVIAAFDRKIIELEHRA